MKPVLEVDELIQDFGGLRALNEVCLTVHEKEIVALIGPNGAGKTTFFNCITGIYKPTSGDMLLTVEGTRHRLNGRKTYEITALGMARTFQNIRLFSQMTVLENVMVGCHCRTRAGIPFLQLSFLMSSTVSETMLSSPALIFSLTQVARCSSKI